MGVEGPKPYPVVYDPSLGVQYVFQSGYFSVPVLPGTPFGADTQIQYNNAGSMGASSSLTWNDATHTLTVGKAGNVPIIQFPTSSISSETGELLLNAGGSEGLLLVCSSFGDLNLDIAGGPNLIMYAPGSFQSGDFANFNRPLRLDAANSEIQPTARLNIVSTTQGLLPPRMTTTQRNAIVSPAEGLLVYDLTLHKLYGFDGTSWQAAW